MSNKNYCDLVYGKLQELSYQSEDGERYVNYSQAKFVSLAEQLGLDRRTVSKYVAALIKLDMIEEKAEEKRYHLRLLNAKEAALIPFPTLREIINSLNRNSVSIFTYLLNRYVANNENEFIITYKELKEQVGLSTSSTSNNQIIADILKMLSRIALISYETRQESAEKSYIYITKVSNVLPK